MRKYQYYNTGDEADRDIHGNNWGGQTFTPAITHLIGKLQLKFFRVGDPGTITISIKNTATGKPVGGDLCHGTIEGTDITENANGEWYEITLGAGAELAKDTQYAIVVRAPDGDESNKLSWRADISEPTFTGGTYCSSSDSGIDWGTFSGVDAMFEEWGAGEPSPGTTTWGDLPESQISLERIRDAIDDAIQNHEKDPNAHIEEGESLYVHKISEIIDHVVDSIVADKIRRFQISPDKFNLDKLEIWPSIESLDAWVQDGPGDIGIALGWISMASENVENSYKQISSQAYYLGLHLETGNPVFETLLGIYQGTEQIIHFGLGTLATDFVGFKVINDVIYAHIVIDGNVYSTEIGTLGAQIFHTYRIVCTNGVDIKFYIDDVLKHTDTHVFVSTPVLDTALYYKIQATENDYKIMAIVETRFLFDR